MRIALLAAFAACSTFAQDKVDLDVVYRIKQEAFRNSKVMEHLHRISDQYGPRLTASPQFQRAAEWTMSQFREWGLTNVHLEPWGPFGRSWSADQYSVEMIEPGYALLSAKPMAWAAPTAGPVTAEAILAPFETKEMDPKKIHADIDKYIAEHKGKLRGKIVLLTKPKPIEPSTNADFRRLTDAELEERAAAPTPRLRYDLSLSNLVYPEDPAMQESFFDSLPFWATMRFYELQAAEQNRLNQFLKDEGVVAAIATDGRSRSGVVFAEAAGSHRASEPGAPPKFAAPREQYNRMARLIEHKTAVRLRLNLRVTASEKDVDASNIIAEIRGTTKPDEVVMIGAHFDSWHTGTGATDNGTGSVVMIETMRVLKALGLKMDRTVRIGLWSGEEQGIYGSEHYIRQHFGNPETMELKPEHAKLSVYLNHDNGMGKIRGVYLQENEAARPVFESWMAPFRDFGARTISIRNTGGTDHLSFDAIGLPGFQFIQDPADYGTKTHHSDIDTVDHVQEADLMQASAIVSTLVYHAANRKDMFPRKPLPLPLRK